jgi:Domain of unknown function (DUF1996)
MPNGLKMLTGNSSADYPQKTSTVQWNCAGESKKLAYILECDGNNLQSIITFPECWDGVNLDSLDHQSHLSYLNGDFCPSSHPVLIPRLQLKVNYGIKGGNGYKLVSDLMQLNRTGYDNPGNTLHADSFIAWSGNSMLSKVINCNRAGKKCGL